MQNDSWDPESLLKKCPYCGKEIKKSSYRCPYCRESLAEFDQRVWEESSPSITTEESSSPGGSNKFLQFLRSPFFLLMLVAGIFLLTFYLYSALVRKPEEENLENEFRRVTARNETDLRSEWPPPPLRIPAFSEAEEDADSPQPATAGSTATKGPAASQEEASTATADEGTVSAKAPAKGKNREQEIQRISGELMEELKKQEAVTPDTVILKTGAELSCTILEKSDSAIKIRYKGLTTTIDNGRIQKVESRPPEEVEKQLRKLALDKATRIVDDGLIRYGNEWISPEERELRMLTARVELERERLKAAQQAQSAPEAPEPAEQKPERSKPAPTSGKDYSSITIQEGFGFDDIVLGHPRSTRAFIKSKLGEPDLENKNLLDYNWKYGFELYMAQDVDTVVEIHLNNRRFKGKLMSGISITSTKEEVFEAYGRPITEEEVDDLSLDYHNYESGILYKKDFFSRINYRESGLLFWFDGNHIVQICIGRI